MTQVLPKLLIVDDDEEIRTQLKWALTKDYQVKTANDRASALEAVRSERPAVVLLDLGLPPRPSTPEEGLLTLGEIHALDPRVKVIISSGQNDKKNAMEAVGGGAYDFLGKPVEMDELKLVLKRAFYVAQLEQEFRELKRDSAEKTFEGMLGSSPRMQSVFSSIRKVATTDAPVLILGESGTGKERAARAIHQLSSRRDEPFIPINCSAIPEALIESELFGHEKGAFTGAHAQRKGRIESAHGGTLFLDEIGEVPLQLQVKLLRFLQDQVIERVGGRQEIQVDVRVLAATNANLQKGMTTGTFREDLYYRLAVVQLTLPPLRERGDDIVLLAQWFMKEFSRGTEREGVVMAPDAVRGIKRYEWPGNVRELQNRVRRAVIMGQGKKLVLADLELPLKDSEGASLSLKEAREQVEREMVTQALQKHSNQISAAATDLGISRPTLYELMAKLGINRVEDQSPRA